MARFDSVVAPPLGPVPDVMPLAERQSAPRKATAPVPMMKRASNSRRNRAGPGADLNHSPVRLVTHDHPGRVARQAARRFRGNVSATVQDRLAWRVGICEYRRVDVDHDLVPLARGAWVEIVLER